MRRQRFFKVSAALVGILLLVGLVGLNSAQASPANPNIAYDTGVQTGNQNFGGSLGMDFDVITPITVTMLGVFDSAADGIIGTTLYAAIFDRTGTNPIIGPTISFTTADPGTLINGSRFKDAVVPLGVGQYSIVAWGYNDSELNGNYFLNTNPGGTGGLVNLSTLDTLGGRISFEGSSRYSFTPGDYPGTADFGPEPNQYLAGTFAVPLPPTALLLGSGLLGLGLFRFRKRA